MITTFDTSKYKYIFMFDIYLKQNENGTPLLPIPKPSDDKRKYLLVFDALNTTIDIFYYQFETKFQIFLN